MFYILLLVIVVFVGSSFIGIRRNYRKTMREIDERYAKRKAELDEEEAKRYERYAKEQTERNEIYAERQKKLADTLEALKPAPPDDTKKNPDLELWGKFLERCTEQTKVGVLQWRFHYSGEFKVYFVAQLQDHELWVKGTEELAVVETSGARFWINGPWTRELRKAVEEQIGPPLVNRMRQFAQEFLNEKTSER